MKSIKCLAVLATAFFYLLYLSAANATIMCAQRDSHLMLRAASIMNNTNMAKLLTASYSDRTGILSIVSCEKYCYAAWLEEKTDKGPAMKFFIQGCWLTEGKADYLNCKSDECMGVWKWNLKQCCCNETNCNINVTDPMENKMIIPSTLSKVDVVFMSLDPEPMNNNTPKNLDIILSWTLSIAILLIFVVGYAVARYCKKRRAVKIDEETSEENGQENSEVELDPKNNIYAFDNMKFVEVVGRGKYGSVYLAKVGVEELAVKIFPVCHEDFFKSEHETYCLPLMEHPSLLKYLGWNKRYNLDGKLEYLLMLSYAPGGSLAEFLMANTFDMSIFIKMARSIVKGLSYLHMEKRVGDKIKPAIVHRDLNPRNILIKGDGSCCICNLGHALRVAGSKVYQTGETQPKMVTDLCPIDAEGHWSIQYMAPEMLDGNLTYNVETALKQVDVYALGVILWELLSRCIDNYEFGTEIPCYKLPFGKELEYDFTWEKVKTLVFREKCRPLFEGKLSKDPDLKLLRDTIEDCWDSDPEARLTTLCVEERMTVVENKHEQRKSNPAGPSRQYDEPMPSTSNNLRGDQNREDCALIEPGCVVRYKGVPSFSAKNSNEQASMQPLIQPHQGRNPCLERNLLPTSNSYEELDFHGNMLIYRSTKLMTQERKLLIPQQPQSINETQSFLPHDYLAQQQMHHQQLSLRPITPIPYVQNVISDSSGSSTTTTYNKLKETNIHDSRNHHRYTSLSSAASPKRRSRFAGWTQLKKLLSSKRSNYNQSYSTSQSAYTRCHNIEREDSKSNLLNRNHSLPISNLDIEEARITGDIGDTVVELEVRDASLERALVNNDNVTVPRMKDKKAISSQTTRFSLINDRIMCNVVDEVGNTSDSLTVTNVNSNSVPFGIDNSEKNEKKFDNSKNITCF
ncbi:uncharacterized protein LOC106651326 isoform X1 [Trichogramma pretiosum]|uniref:uncharacterized protein LOC106651326 isoform X1 n=1 Tax=Trichogramma pretiosum TaxID=7493 RepID=UPI0006C9CC51|nr:uncharacterized protein LOC106651326 isoform X1 [Trichogramma pretiosum]XP_023317925.1 uncharacterized protein LOC106651326 isoform X1 [Trichogramma pretiosum]